MLSVPAWTTWLLALVFLPVVIGLVIFFVAEGDNPGNGFEHHSEDDEPPDTGTEDVLLAA